MTRCIRSNLFRIGIAQLSYTPHCYYTYSDADKRIAAAAKKQALAAQGAEEESAKIAEDLKSAESKEKPTPTKDSKPPAISHTHRKKVNISYPYK